MNDNFLIFIMIFVVTEISGLIGFKLTGSTAGVFLSQIITFVLMLVLFPGVFGWI